MLRTPNSSYKSTEISKDTFIYALTEQWFGNLVTPVWWNHNWLKDGLAHYMQYYINEKVLISYKFRMKLQFFYLNRIS